MSVIEEISKLLKNGCDDDVLLNYIYENHDEIECELSEEEIECELNGEEIECELSGKVYEKPKKRDRYFCMGCKLRKIVDYERSILVCTKCGVFEYYPVHVPSYNHTMRYSRSKCVYKRYDNFKTILNQFFYGGNRVVPDDIMKTIRNEICNRDNILYNYTIPLTIPILECILKRNKMMKYKNSIYFIFFKLKSQPLPYITITEKDMMLNMFNVVSNIYDKYKPKDRKSFLSYPFVLKQILIVLGKNDYAKYIPQLKTHSKQKELERVWELITKDPEWAAALQKRKIV